MARNSGHSALVPGPGARTRSDRATDQLRRTNNAVALPLCTVVDQEVVADSWTVPLAVPPYGAFNINRGVKSLSCARTVPGRHSTCSRGDRETDTPDGRAVNAVVTAPATVSPTW